MSKHFLWPFANLEQCVFSTQSQATIFKAATSVQYESKEASQQRAEFEEKHIKRLQQPPHSHCKARCWKGGDVGLWRFLTKIF